MASRRDDCDPGQVIVRSVVPLWGQAREIADRAGLLRWRPLTVATAFVLTAAVAGLLEGTSFVLLINLVSGGAEAGSADAVTRTALGVLRWLGGSAQPHSVLAFVIGLILLRAGLTFVAGVLESLMNAHARRRLQHAALSVVLSGAWEHLRMARVGQSAGALSEEAAVVAKLLVSSVRTLQALLTAVVMVSVAAAVSVELTQFMLIAVVPAVIVLRYMFHKVAATSLAHVVERQGLVADVTERLANLFQIKVEGDARRHIAEGSRHQGRLTTLEVRIGLWQGAITAFNVALPALVLAEFALWFALRGESLLASLSLLTSVGVIGARAAGHLNNAQAALGNLSRLAGSIPPVYALFKTPPEPERARLPETLAEVRGTDVSYRYFDGARVHHTSFVAQRGLPLIIRGPSGVGKTTLANVAAGVMGPTEGTITYVGASGTAFPSTAYRPVTGYVTQDIQLFHGTVADNLSVAAGDEEWAWKCLRASAADSFVRELGGLDAAVVEGGRSLSGGQRRRLGIARALIRRPQLLILDEVTAGLDDAARKEVESTIRELALSLVVIVISHDAVDVGRGSEIVLGEQVYA